MELSRRLKLQLIKTFRIGKLVDDPDCTLQVTRTLAFSLILILFTTSEKALLNMWMTIVDIKRRRFHSRLVLSRICPSAKSSLDNWSYPLVVVRID